MNELPFITAKNIADTIKHTTDTVTVRVDSAHAAENIRLNKFYCA